MLATSPAVSLTRIVIVTTCVNLCFHLLDKFHYHCHDCMPAQPLLQLLPHLRRRSLPQREQLPQLVPCTIDIIGYRCLCYYYQPYVFYNYDCYYYCYLLSITCFLLLTTDLRTYTTTHLRPSTDDLLATNSYYLLLLPT